MIDNTKEYIIASAIWYKDGKPHAFQNAYGIDNGFVVCGFRHPLVIVPMADIWACKTEAEQGFITSLGRFVDRKEAAKIAFECGQVDKELKSLFSEDVFPNQKWFANASGEELKEIQ